MNKYTMHHGNCLDILPTLIPESIDTCITDPPYGLKFMGKDWDNGIPGKTYWEAVYDVLKPGGFCLAFGGTRTFHRLMCAIEDAGFQLRDTIMWVYGSGFPKSHNISKAIDKAAKVKRKVIGTRPGKGGQNLNQLSRSGNDSPDAKGCGAYGSGAKQVTIEIPITTPVTEEAQLWNGWGTALKPAWEPVIVAMKPTDGTFANNALTHGVAGLNVDGGRVETEERMKHGGKQTTEMGYHGGTSADGSFGTSQNPLGRFPANLIHDGSEEVVGLFPQTKSGSGNGNAKSGSPGDLTPLRRGTLTPRFDHGSASRFFYCAKASKKDRGEGNTHPTVKPQALMEYLCRLTATPTGGTVLDPFAGSGSTGVACMNTGRDFIGCEIDADYCDIAKGRLSL